MKRLAGLVLMALVFEVDEALSLVHVAEQIIVMASDVGKSTEATKFPRENIKTQRAARRRLKTRGYSGSKCSCMAASTTDGSERRW